MAEYIYSMRKVRKAHGDKVILDDVNLNFLPGAKIGVVGPNGAGKSSVLRIMAGLDIPNNGDALLAPTPGDVTFPLALKLLGPGLVVSDDEVLDAMETAFREFKLVVEPGGAVALAAALTGKLPVKGRAVAVVCSGGNVDHATFARALSRRST